MAEYYSKEQLLKSGRTTLCDMYDLEDFLDEILAENVLRITRCKDCEYSNDDGTICRYSVGRAVEPEHFCSYGIPKNDEVRE